MKKIERERPETGEPLRNYVRNSVVTGYLNILGSGLSVFIFLPVIVRSLGLEDYARWAVVLIPVGIASILDFGLSKAIVLLGGPASSQDELGRLLGAAVRIYTGLSLMVVAIGVVLVVTPLGAVLVPNSLTDVGSILILTGAVAAASQVLTNFYRAQLETFFYMPIVNVAFLLLTVSTYGLVALAAARGSSVRTLLLLTSGVYAGNLMLHAGLVEWKIRPDYRRPTRADVKRLARQSSRLFSVGLFDSLLQPTSRYVVIRFSESTAAFAVFDISLRIATLATTLVSNLAQPLLALFARHGKAATRAYMARYAYLASALFLLGIACYALFGRAVLATIFPQDVAAMYRVTGLLLLGIPMSGIVEVFTRQLYALGRADRLFQARMLGYGLATLVALLAVGASEPLETMTLVLSLGAALTALQVVRMSRSAPVAL